MIEIMGRIFYLFIDGFLQGCQAFDHHRHHGDDVSDSADLDKLEDGGDGKINLPEGYEQRRGHDVNKDADNGE